MKKFFTLSALLLFVCFFQQALAQEREITGKITSKDDNKPLAGVTVVVKGTTLGTATDVNGNYDLKGVPADAKLLVFSAVGIKTQEVPITASNNYDVVMETDALKLNAVVVTALGTSQEKEQLGYATQEVGSDQLNNTGTSNMMDELDGKVAGLQVINSSGDPGAGTYINLRGPTSITGNNQPLIVIDGIPIDNSINNYDPSQGSQGFLGSGPSGQLNAGTQPTNRGLDINPSDIESITVLKGPAAAALYGIEAANGAIIITTKKGQKNVDGNNGIEFNSSLTFSKVNNLPSYQEEFAQGDNGVYSGPTSGNRDSWGPPISQLAFDGIPTPYDKHGSLVPAAPGLTPAIAYNPYDFFQTGVATDNNLSFSGGNDKSSFRMSIGNLSQTGVIPMSSYYKNTVNINGQSALSKRLKVSAGVNFINSTNNKVQQGNNTSGVMFLVRTPPTFDNSNGNGANAVNNPSTYILPSDSERDYRGGTPGYDNPYWTVNENTFVSNLNRIYGYSQLEYDLNNWIKITYRVGGDVYAQDDKNYYNPLSNTLNYEGGGIFITDYINSIINSDIIASFNHKLTDNLSLNGILGQNYYENTTDTRLAEGTGLTLPNFPNLGNASSYNGTTESEVQYLRSAWYGQFILGYMHQVFLTLSGRDETTSTLAANNDNFFYPSADLAWVFTETLKMNTNVLPYGKLRLSYANVGQDAPPQLLTTPFAVASNNDGGYSTITFPFNGTPGFATSQTLGNPNLVAQSTAATEVGLDLAFLQNRVGVSATYYNEKTTNEILSVPIPYSTGYGATELNAGIVTNKGIEIVLNTTPIKLKNGFQWDLGVTWSHNDNMLVQLAPGVQSLRIDALGTLYDVPGYSIDQIFGSDYARIPGTTYNPANPTANLVLNDQPGPGYGLPMASPNAPAPLAPTQPNWIGGLTTSFKYKNFALGGVMSIREGGYTWDGTIGAMDYYGTAGATENRGQTYQIPAGAVWGNFNGPGGTLQIDKTAPGPETATYSQYYYQNLTSIYAGLTTPNIYPSGYVRISQINFTYSLPHNLLRKAHFTQVSITAFANNPFLWTKYPGVDPSTSFGGPANNQGEDWFNNPGTKSYGLRLNIRL